MMAYIFVERQTPNSNINKTSTQNETLLPMAHSVDNGLFTYRQNSTSLLHFLRKFSSESQISMYHSTSNGFLNKNSTLSALSNTTFLLDEPEEAKQEEGNYFNCDKIETVIAVNTHTEQVNKISAAKITDELDNDIILNATSSLNIKCHFFKPKQRSSLTRTSSSNDETGSIITDDNNSNQEEKSQEISEDLQPIAIESLSLNENNEKKEDNLVKNEESNNKNPASNRLRGRSEEHFSKNISTIFILELRYKLYHHTSSASEKSASDNVVQPIVPTQASISPPPSTSSPSPMSLTTNVFSSAVSPNILTGDLKHTGSISITKKTVRFADSIGLELTQVQYIQSSTNDDDSIELSFVKSNIYISKASNYQLKPWSFDVALTSKQTPNIRTPKRFFCLYHQPISENPDIYLHEVRKSHIKLEHADIFFKSSLNGEQYLDGTLWVTNDNYWKIITVKYTFNSWLNTYEYKAQHICHSNDFRNIDQFEFSIDIPDDIDRIDFILCYCVNGQEHWDNNKGNNYTLETESAYTPKTTISLPHDFDINEMRFY